MVDPQSTNSSISGDISGSEPGATSIELGSQDSNTGQRSSFADWRWLERIIVLLLIVPPFAFGAVHPRVFLSIESVVFLVAAIFAWGVISNRLSLVFGGARLATVVLFGLLALLGYELIQQAILSLMRTAHPVVTETSPAASLAAFLSAFRAQIFAVTLILGALFLASNRPHFSRQIIQVEILVGLLVSMTAIAHWFYDNGKLFWIFEPDYLAVTNRARWPFVNPNHLAIFLLPIFFIAVGEFLRVMNSAADLITRNHSIQFVRLIQHSSMQRLLLSSVYSFTVLFSIGIAIAGAQSRGAWLGLSVGIVLLALLTPKRDSAVPQNPLDLGDSSERSSRSVVRISSSGGVTSRRRRTKSESKERRILQWRYHLARSWRVICLLGAVALLLVFLNEKGRDLVAGRIEFGLKYSLEDMRFTFFGDSLRMLMDAPIFGVGLGGWASNYPKYMSLQLASINPVYLHSDPFQYLIELGIFGFSIVLVLGLAILATTVRAIRLPVLRSFGDRSYEFLRRQHKARFTAIGLLALIVASLFDFPFRVPAIVINFSVLLGITVFCASRAISISDSSK